MGMAIAIGGGLFVALYALLWLNVRHWEEERGRAGAAPAPTVRRCASCDRRLRAALPPEELVREVERRIEREQALIAVGQR
jgi:hypothetical protein